MACLISDNTRDLSLDVLISNVETVCCRTGVRHIFLVRTVPCHLFHHHRFTLAKEERPSQVFKLTTSIRKPTCKLKQAPFNPYSLFSFVFQRNKMGIIGKDRRSLLGLTKLRVTKTQEGSPSRSGGDPKDHKKRRFPSSLFKRGRHSTASTLLDLQQTSTESNTSPAVSDQPADNDKSKDRAFDRSCTTSRTSSAPSLAPFEEGLCIHFASFFIANLSKKACSTLWRRASLLVVQLILTRVIAMLALMALSKVNYYRLRPFRREHS